MVREAQRSHVPISRELLEEVDRLVGRRRREQFLDQAVRDKLRQARLRATAEDVAGSLADVDVPGWESSDSTAAWVHQLRHGDNQNGAEPGR